MNRAQRRRGGAHATPYNYTPIVYPRPRRSVVAHSVMLACLNWHQADKVTPEWWAQALEAR